MVVKREIVYLQGILGPASQPTSNHDQVFVVHYGYNL